MTSHDVYLNPEHEPQPLSLRDYLAILYARKMMDQCNIEVLARASYAFSDAMLTAREVKP